MIKSSCIICDLITEVGSVNNFVQQTMTEKTQEYLIKLAEDCFTAENELLDSIRACMEMYAFLIEADVDVSQLLNSTDSMLETQLVAFFKKPVTSFDMVSGPKMLKIILNIEPFLQFFEAIEIGNLVVFSFELAILYADSSLALRFQSFWKYCVSTTTNEYIKNDLRPMIYCAKNSFMCSSFTDEGLKLGNVLLSMSLEGLIQAILTAEELQDFIEQLWAFIGEKLFSSNTANPVPLAEKVTSKVAKRLNLMLRIVIALNMEDGRIHRAIFDETPVSNGREILTKGDHMQHYLSDSLVHSAELKDLDELKNKVSMQKIGELLEKFLHVLKKDKPLRRLYGEEMVAKCLQIWTPLYLNCDSQRIKIITFSLASVHYKGCQNSLDLATWWKNMMTSQTATLKEKADLIHFVGLFLFSTSDEVQEILRCKIILYSRRTYKIVR